MTWAVPGPAFLFCPADRPDRFAKAASAADVVILDLEDGVAPERREEARAHLRAASLDPATTIVRINPASSPEHALDLASVRETAVSMVMLAKTESPDEVLALDEFSVVALLETPRGVLAAEEIAQCTNTLGLMWGAEDLVAALGGLSSRGEDKVYRDVARYARSRTLLAARAEGRCALDAVCLLLDDLELQRTEALDAAAVGFAATVCVHPSQVPIVRAAYRPSDEQLAWATHILDASRGRAGVFRVGELMVDEPVLAQARLILRRGDVA
ncbi:MAG TPA: CoA ester lyase [Acidimicrobiales bacterium]|nr:CoA ester lyase [Acidimicrobiales bacterium]